MPDLSGYSLAALLEQKDNVAPIHFIRELGEEEAREIGRSVSRLLKFSTDQNLFLITELNFHDLESALKEYDANFRQYTTSYVSVETMITNVARLILNYLSALRMFVDHSETAMKRLHGASGDRFARFKAALSEQYDGVFAYRFLYRFRNFVQHLGLPIDSWERSEDAECGPMPLRILLKKERLLRDSDVWGPQVLREIKALPDKIAITELIPKVRPCLNAIRIAYYQDDITGLRADAFKIDGVVGEILKNVGGPCYPVFARAVPQADPSPETKALNIVLSHIPMHAIAAAKALTYPDVAAPADVEEPHDAVTTAPPSEGLMDDNEWSRLFWVALKADGGKWTFRFHTFENGNTILETVGTVDGKGVLLRWLSAERGVVTVRKPPYGAPEEKLDGVEIAVLLHDDPAAMASFARDRLSQLV